MSPESVTIELTDKSQEAKDTLSHESLNALNLLNDRITMIQVEKEAQDPISMSLCGFKVIKEDKPEVKKLSSKHRTTC